MVAKTSFIAAFSSMSRGIAAAFLDEAAFSEVGGADPDAVPNRHPVNGQQRVEVVGETGDRCQVLARERVGEPVRC
ncbi:MAG TPA: hypothetical protein VJS67_14545, partial [Pseudonocardiaceae bacterium]|nr:hypothetical protein [Pseudonocardiaceae bacterium]